MTEPDLAAAVRSLMPRARQELAELVAFPSIADPELGLEAECRAAAEWVAEALRTEGLTNVRLVDTPDGTASVYGELLGVPGAPTVLLYSHYDVQPELDAAGWDSPPFELTERDGRWYGRGAADCKGNILMHLMAIRALRATGGALPFNLKVIVEGSEEQGFGGLEEYALAHPELLAADLIIIGDVGNFAAGKPTATASLRGICEVTAEVRTLEGNMHSGQFGGAAPDPLAALVRMLDSLYDEHGGTVIKGLPCDQTWSGVSYPEERFRSDAKVLDGVQLIGTGEIGDRLWARPAVTVVGIDVPPVVGSTGSVQAGVRAKLSLRVPPGMDVKAAQAALIAHLESVAPWRVQLTVTAGPSGSAFSAHTSGPAYEALKGAAREAYGTELALAGMGGSIPLCSALAGLYPAAEIVLIGVEEPTTQIHALNESLDPAELERMTLTEALFLRDYARTFGK